MSVFVTLGGVSTVARADTRYVVHRGNTLWGIAQTHHTTVTTLMKRNALHTTVLQINQTLMIPDSPQVYVAAPHGIAFKKKQSSLNGNHHTVSVVRTVQSGDTLWKLAVDNHTTVETLIALNHLSSTVIHPGQKLTVYKPGVKVALYRVSQGRTQNINLHLVSQKGIPLQLIPVYQAAGARYGIPWTVLAAIHRKETNFSTHAIVSYAGAQGPMQFMPSTFERYGVTAPGQHGAPDINNVYDAIYTAARMLALDGYAKNPAAAIYQYNHSMSYVDSIQALAQEYEV